MTSAAASIRPFAGAMREVALDARATFALRGPKRRLAFLARAEAATPRAGAVVGRRM